MSDAVVWLRVIPDTATTFLDTVTTQVALFSPALAVMVAVPAATAVTTPFSTVATVASEVVQVTVLSVASAGVTVAVRVTVSPSVRAAVVWLRAIPDTATTFLATVTTQVAVLSPALAVMVAVPTATAVTLPEASTVATAVFEELHVTVLSAASSGVTVAVRVTVPPSTKSTCVLSNIIEFTGIIGQFNRIGALGVPNKPCGSKNKTSSLSKITLCSFV